MLFSESYLSQPIAEFLLKHHRGRLSPEHNHPNFVGHGGAGRPKQVDFALLPKRGNRIEAVIEAKWVTGTTSRQAIVNDCLGWNAFEIPQVYT